LGNIGILVKEEGKVKTIAPRRAGKGAAIGLGIGAIAAILSGGMTLIGGMLAGGLFGGAAGALFKKSLGLSAQDVEQISQHLNSGQAAVVVMCDDYEMEGVVSDMRSSGGTVNSFEMSSALLPETEKAVSETVSATQAAVGEVAAVTAAGADEIKEAADATVGAVKEAADATADTVKHAAETAGDAVQDAVQDGKSAPA
jgi:hypothetical protein